MCLVCVFIFVRKAEHMYEIFFFFNLDRELPDIPSLLISLHHYLISLLFPQQKTKPLRFELISIDASEHPRLSFTVVGSHLHRQHSKIQPEIELLSPPTHHSKIQVRISLSPSLSMDFGAKSEEFLKLRSLFFCFCFCFSSPIEKTHFSYSLFAVEMEL